MTARRSILLTGGCGFIGSHIAMALAARGDEAILLDNFSNSKADVLKRLETLRGSPFRFYEGDVCDPHVLDYVFSHETIDAVIHLAGYKAVGESVRKPLAYYSNNLNATLRLTEAMLRHNVHQIVFSSSATVYGVPEKLPLTEDMPTSATNPYGETKRMSEIILRDAVHACPQLSVVLLRYFNPVGAHPSGLIGEDPNGVPNNLVPYITQVAIGKLEVLRVFGNDYPTPDGSGVRDYIHVMDLAEGHCAALDYAESRQGLEIVNLGTGRGSSVFQLIHAFERVSGKRIPYVIAPRRPGDVAACYADVSKARALLHWEARRSLDEMMRDAWNFQSRNPKGYEA